MEKVVRLKKGRAKNNVHGEQNDICRIHQKLCKEFNATHVPVSLTTLFKFKLFYCVLPSEKEKQSCACINCQNSHLLHTYFYKPSIDIADQNTYNW